MSKKKDWSRVTLGELGNYINGKAFKPEQWSSSGLPIIRIQNLTDERKPFNYFNGSIENRYLIDSGDLLISWSATLGSFIWNRGKAVLNQHIFKVIPNDEKVDKEFLHYLVLNALDEMAEHSHGIAMQHITKGKFEAIKVFVPPVSEQHRIVARIKECMEKIEEIEKLHDEVSYESKALPTASKYDLWKDCENEFELIPLGDCVSSAKNGLYKHKKFHGTGTVLLRMFNIRDGELDPRRLERVQVTAKELSDFEVRNGDLVVSRVNSRELVGKSAVVLGLSEPAINEAMIIRLRVDPEMADSQFLSWLINSPQFLHELRGRAKHAIGQSSINQTDLLSSKIPLPNLARQREIVTSAVRFLPAVTDLQAEVNPQGEVISHLRDAILRKAFAGEL